MRGRNGMTSIALRVTNAEMEKIEAALTAQHVNFYIQPAMGQDHLNVLSPDQPTTYSLIYNEWTDNRPTDQAYITGICDAAVGFIDMSTNGAEATPL